VSLLRPVIALVEDQALGGERVHHDDTHVPVLAAGKTITGRIWGAVRDDRSFGGTEPPAVAYWYSRDRSGVHPQRPEHERLWFRQETGIQGRRCHAI
jgi:transposase